jgi:hypothetical protein
VIIAVVMDCIITVIVVQQPSHIISSNDARVAVAKMKIGFEYALSDDVIKRNKMLVKRA